MSDPITPLTPEEQKTAENQAKNEGYVMRELIAIDELGATTLGDKNDETISSWSARLDTEDHGVKHVIGEVVSKGLDLFQKDHGAKAEAGDLERAKEVESLEDNSGSLPDKE